MTTRKRAHAAEHIRGDQYRVRRYVKDRGDGKPGQKSRTFHAPNQLAANRMAARELDALDKQITEATDKSQTLAGLISDYLKFKARLRSWSPSTTDRNTHILTVCANDIGHIRLAKLTARHVDDWYGTLTDRGLSPQTVNHYAAQLHAVLHQGDKWERVTTRAAMKATKPRVDPVEVTPPPAPLVRLLLETAEPRLRMALYVAALTGLRRGEIVGLRWADFDASGVLVVSRSVLDRPAAEGGRLVKSTKSRKVRRFTVDPALLDELAAYRERVAVMFGKLGTVEPSDWFVFADLEVDRSGQTPMRPGWLSTAWTRHREAHGASTVNLHHLRHWFASTLESAGVPRVVVQARLGHADASTTGLYSHALPAGDAAAAGMATRALLGDAAAGVIGQRLALPSTDKGDTQ